jgi:hypothetical protein
MAAYLVISSGAFGSDSQLMQGFRITNLLSTERAVGLQSGPHFSNGATAIAEEWIGEGDAWVEKLSDEEIAMIQRRGVNSNEQLAAAWHRFGHVIELQWVVHLARFAFDLLDDRERDMVSFVG